MRKLNIYMGLLLLATCNASYAEPFDRKIKEIYSRYSVSIHYKYNRADFFPESWRRPPMDATGEQIPYKEAERLLPIIEKFILAYPPSFMKTHLADIYLMGNLTGFGKRYGASYNVDPDVIYVTSQGAENGDSDELILSQLHSEFSSILMRKHKFSEAVWNTINPAGFRYSGTGVEMLGRPDLYAQDPELLSKGFLFVYSQSSLENDLNMIAFWLFTRPKQLKELCGKYEKLRLKTDLVVSFYRSIGISTQL